MKPGQKILIGIFTFLPFLLTPYILYEVFHFVMETIAASENGDPEPAVIFAGIASFIFPIILLSITSLALLIYYIIHAAGNKTIDTTERIIWIVLFVFFGIIAFPVYFFMRM